MSATTATGSDSQSRRAGGTLRQERPREQVKIYLKLCRNPSANLKGWIDQTDRKRRTASRATSRPREQVEDYLNLCRNPAADLKGWIDATDRKPTTIRAERGPRGQVENYLTLCKNPAANLSAWAEQTTKQTPAKKGLYNGFSDHQQRTTPNSLPETGGTERLCKNSLPEMRLRLDENKPAGESITSLFTRQGADLFKPSGLHSLRGTGSRGRIKTTGRDGKKTGGGQALKAFKKHFDSITRPTSGRNQQSAKINQATVSAAGQFEARRFALMMAAIKGDKSQTREQREAILNRLRAESAAAVEKAKQEAMQREQTRVKAIRQQQPQKPPSGPDFGL